ncbi:MAG TPA: glycosyltransferase [Gaiellaceae bacterium]|nr:glycosyltransferase [Gaiellaceae bacterium]
MIFVSVGTHEAPFDRMLRAVDELGVQERIVIQHGPSDVRVRNAEHFEYLPFDEVVDLIREARAVVMHAGVGSVMISLTNGKRPIVMAREARLGEHVDDHQLELARRLEASGLVTLAVDAESLGAALARGPEPVGALDTPWLGNELRDYLSERLGAPPSPVASRAA